MNEWLKELFN